MSMKINLRKIIQDNKNSVNGSIHGLTPRMITNESGEYHNQYNNSQSISRMPFTSFHGTKYVKGITSSSEIL